jgi:hypothetical protein
LGIFGDLLVICGATYPESAMVYSGIIGDLSFYIPNFANKARIANDLLIIK